MKDSIDNASRLHARRKVLSRLGKGGVLAGAAAGTSPAWVKPVVDTVILPVHAECSLVCDVQLSVGAASVPAACSGSVFPQISLLIEVSQGCGDIFVETISPNLPGQASMESGVSPGSRLATGSSFTINIDNYPSSSPFACQATDAGSIMITYQCDGHEGQSQSFTIDVLRTILENAPEPEPVPSLEPNLDQGESETTS